MLSYLYSSTHMLVGLYASTKCPISTFIQAVSAHCFLTEVNIYFSLVNLIVNLNSLISYSHLCALSMFAVSFI